MVLKSPTGTSQGGKVRTGNNPTPPCPYDSRRQRSFHPCQCVGRASARGRRALFLLKWTTDDHQLLPVLLSFLSSVFFLTVDPPLRLLRFLSLPLLPFFSKVIDSKLRALAVLATNTSVSLSSLGLIYSSTAWCSFFSSCLIFDLHYIPILLHISSNHLITSLKNLTGHTTTRHFSLIRGISDTQH
ncbi:hypothetical protein GE09DRAFT_326775 [Coniochaeta sp. 2T2.1]|nr:hypothetical protein GE09DRAFT_326775 [Coniochaeta sp. 2T2.1]